MYSFALRPLIFKLQQKVSKFNDMRELKLLKNWPKDKFLNLESRSFENVSFSQYTFFLNKQSIFDSRPKNCLSFSKKSPQKIV